MPTSSQLERRKLEDWSAERLRLTVFPVKPISSDKIVSWEALVGSPPADITSKPREGIFHEQGPFEGGMLIFRKELIRFDLIFNAEIGMSPPEQNKFPLIASYGVAVEKFLPLVRDLLAVDLPPINRIAFGGTFTLEVESREAGYEQLKPYLPNVQIDEKYSRDFLYRINRPRQLKLTDFEIGINRLSTWSVVMLQGAQISIAGETSQVWSEKQLNACRLELDINTQEANREPIPADKLLEVFENMLQMGNEIAEMGDVS